METDLRERERGGKKRRGKKGKLSLYPSRLLSYKPAHNSTNPSDARFPLVLSSFQPAFTLCASCTWTLYVYRRAPCATKTRNSARRFAHSFTQNYAEPHFFVNEYPCELFLSFWLIIKYHVRHCLRRNDIVHVRKVKLKSKRCVQY